MKFFIMFILVLIFAGCSQKEMGVKLEQGSQDYNLAMALSEKVAAFNPDDNKVIASTSEFSVTAGDVVQRIRANFGKNAESLTSRSETDLTKLLNEFATNIAVTKITLLEAENDGITVSDSRIDSVINQRIARMGGKEKFLQYLEDNGAEEQNIYRDIRIGEIHREYVNAKRKELSVVTDAEVEDALKGDRFATVRHILLLTQGKTEEEKVAIRKKMEDILAEAKSGEDFAELATKYTEDPGSKAKGGLYENFPKGRMVPSFEEAAFAVPVGEISDIIETPYGYHILKVIDRKKEDRPIEQVKNELQRNKQRTVIFELYEDLKKEYNLEIVGIS